MKGMPSFGMHGDLVYEPMWISNEYVEYQQTAMFIDPAGRGSDETAICVASICNGFIWIHLLEGLEGGYDDFVLKKISNFVNEFNLKLIMVESNYGDGMFNKLLHPVIAERCGQVAIEEYKVSGQKEKRMLESIEPVMAQHRLVIDKKAIKQEETQRQITRLHGARGALRHDDRIDVLSAAVSFWKENLSVDVDNQVAKNKERLRLEEVDDWAKNFRAANAIGHGAVKQSDISNIKVNNNRSKWATRSGRRF